MAPSRGEQQHSHWQQQQRQLEQQQLGAVALSSSSGGEAVEEEAARELRGFTSNPKFAADWGGNYAEKLPSFLELFLDLVVVAACSKLAELLKEDLSWDGLGRFLVLFWTLETGWNLYTTWASRVSDDSLTHYLQVFVMMMGYCTMVLNCEPGHGFAAGALIVRVSLLGMYLSTYVALRAAREQFRMELAFLSCSVGVLVLSLSLPESATLGCLAAVFLLESFVFMFCNLTRFCGLRREWRRVPLNIEHSNERQGCFVMVVLGEAVVSAIINAESAHEAVRVGRYYIMMTLSLATTFSAAMLYYAISPPRTLHAMRRSKYTGVAWILIHMPTLASLLAMGVGCKFVNDATVHGTLMEAAQVRTLFFSLALAQACFAIIRLLHMWGREPKAGDPPFVRKLKYAWWGWFIVSPGVPIAIQAVLTSSEEGTDPILAIALTLCSIFPFVVAEAIVVDLLKCLNIDHVTIRDVREHSTAHAANERTPLRDVREHSTAHAADERTPLVAEATC
jgi:low temperature requirement protein LtrA